VIEWSNFKPGLGPDVRLRGTEWYTFDEAGLISKIRAYYACPARRPRRDLRAR
jgi:hypothetical protein